MNLRSDRRAWKGQLASGLLARAHPRADEGEGGEAEGEQGVFGVVMSAAGLLAGEEGRQLAGGLDDEDWSRYRVHVNGSELAEWRGSGRWREPSAATYSS